MALELDIPELGVLVAGAALVVEVVAGAAAGALAVLSLVVGVAGFSVVAAAGFSAVSLPPGFILSE